MALLHGQAVHRQSDLVTCRSTSCCAAAGGFIMYHSHTLLKTWVVQSLCLFEPASNRTRSGTSPPCRASEPCSAHTASRSMCCTSKGGCHCLQNVFKVSANHPAQASWAGLGPRHFSVFDGHPRSEHDRRCLQNLDKSGNRGPPGPGFMAKGRPVPHEPPMFARDRRPGPGFDARRHFSPPEAPPMRGSPSYGSPPPGRQPVAHGDVSSRRPVDADRRPRGRRVDSTALLWLPAVLAVAGSLACGCCPHLVCNPALHQLSAQCRH